MTAQTHRVRKVGSDYRRSYNSHQEESSEPLGNLRGTYIMTVGHARNHDSCRMPSLTWPQTLLILLSGLHQPPHGFIPSEQEGWTFPSR
jgi:hypothetical protein